MRVVVFGTGNVASLLAHQLATSQVLVCQVFGRNEQKACALASRVGAQPVTSYAHVVDNADAYFLCVSDDAIQEVAAQLCVNTGVVVHCAGSVAMSVLSRYHHRCGVLYPLQSFSKYRDISFDDIPLLVESSCQESSHVLVTLANLLSRRVMMVDSPTRLKVHLAAVFASNFTNFMATVACDIIQEAGLDFQVLYPLLEETYSKIITTHPRDAQTGPARRNDVETMAKHIALLDTQRGLKELYIAASTLICEKYNKDTCLITRKN